MIPIITPVRVVQMPHAQGLPLPTYAREGDAGMDLLAAVPEGMEVEILPSETVAVQTGLRVAIPRGYELQIRSRSGLASCGIVVANSPGTIDSGYRGEIKVLLHNQSPATFVVTRGLRIAQAVLARVPRLAWVPVAELDATERGEGGFGSTGISA